MKQHYVIGVDGGNSKTHYALSDQEGNLINFIEAGTASHEQLGGYEGMKRELADRILHLLRMSKINLEDVGFSILGLAGADVRKQHEEISIRLKAIGLINFKVCNDAFLGIVAGSEKGYGICSINGTGTSCAGIDKYGCMLQVGGYGSISGDDAGGIYLEQMVITIVYESIYKCGEQTMMKQMLFDLLQISDEGQLMEAVHEQLLTGKLERKRVSRMVFQAANQGDHAALILLKHAGLATARSVIGISKKLDFPEDEVLEIIMAGSIHVKGESPVLLDIFKKEVHRGIKQRPQFHLLKEPPVAGAVIWGLHELNGSMDCAIRRKVLESLF